MRIFSHFNVFEPNNHIFVLGVSATLSRRDEVALGQLFEKIVYHLDIRQVIQNGWLCPAELFQVRTGVNVERARNRSMNGFDTEALNLLINTPERNSLIVKTVSEIIKQNECQRTVIFCLNIAHCESLVAKFAELGIKAVSLTTKNKKQDRTHILSEFKKGNYKILLNCGILTEGTDIPVIDCVVVARPTRSQNLYIQMVGRGLRLHGEKEKCAVIDFVDKGEGLSLVSFPSLLAGPSKAGRKNQLQILSEMEDDTFIEEIDKKKIKVLVEKGTLWEIDMSQHYLDWIKVSNSMFIISFKSEYILLIALDNEGEAKFRICSWENGDMEPREITENSVFGKDVLDFVSSYLKDDQTLKFAMKNAKWKLEPMTNSQRVLLSQISGSRIDRNWTRGTAANIISKRIFMLHLLGKRPKWDQLIAGIRLEKVRPMKITDSDLKRTKYEDTDLKLNRQDVLDFFDES